MTQYIIGESAPGGKFAGVAEAIKSYLGDRQRRQEIERQERERQRLEQAAVDEAQARQYLALRPEQQSRMFPTLSDGARRFLLDPSTIPAAVPTEAEMYEHERIAKNREHLRGYQPDAFESSALGYHLMTGDAPNADTTRTVRDRSYMSPDQFRSHVAEGFVPPSEAAEKRASANRQNAEADFTRGPKTRNENAQAGLYSAQTTESAARTGEVREKTITERESRDPNSSTTKTKMMTAGRKSAAQVQIEDYDARLRQLSQRGSELSIKLAGIGPEGKEGAGKKNAIERRRIEGELSAIRTQIEQTKAKRDRLVGGATKAGANIEQPDPLGILR